MIKQFVTNTAEEFQKRGYVVRTVKYVPNDADNLRIDYGNESLAIRRPSSEVLSRDEYNNRLKELTKSLDLLHDQGFSPTAIYFEAGGSNVVLSENGQYLYIGNSDVEQLNSWLGR
ncbi:MAG: hypothetical protein SFY68_13350 [Candidatus Sumerlaeia bacterium]|nr:hypothetical protein [Candidatus Sumerlaeia bacterium]